MVRPGKRTAWAGVLAVTLGLCGCASSPAPKAAAPPESGATATVAKASPPIELTAMTLSEGAPGLRLEVTANGPLVWTSYRDVEGGLVVELPNTVAGAVTNLKPPTGLVASVDVKQERNADRPLTRLTVRGREDFEYNLASEDQKLELKLLPTGTRAQTAVAEPLPTPAPAPPSAAVEPAQEVAAPPAEAAVSAVPAPPATAPVLWGTPDKPVRGARPGGTPATRLDQVEVVEVNGTTAVEVRGNGQFSYTAFRLTNPERVVLDLEGVHNSSGKPAIAVNGALLDRVRVAQFKSKPESVARVVFDLKQAALPEIDALPDGLRLRFASGEVSATLAQDLATPSSPPSEANYTPPPPPPSAPSAPVAAPPATPSSESRRPASSPAGSGATSDVALFEAAETAGEKPAEKKQVLPQTFTGQTIGGGEKTYSGEPMSLHLKDADVKDVLRSFAQISGLNIIVQPEVRGTVTVELENVPWDQALDEILKINGLGMELDGNILRIAPVAQLRAEAEEQQKLRAAQALSVPLRTVIKHISYAKASEVSRILQQNRGGAGAGASLLSNRGTVTVDDRTNTLIIKELPGFMDTVLAVIDTLDTPEPQVMIEARIVETTKKFSRSLGIQWNFNGIADAAHGNTTGLVFPNNGAGNGGVNLLTGGQNGFLNFTLGNILNTFTLDAALQAAESEGLVNVLSAPKIATLNNESAEIQSGLQIPIQTVANNTVTVQFVNATLRLQVTPHVTAEGTVLMDINVQKREPQLAFAVVGATNAPIDTKEARTRVIVRDGGTTVIGGIYKVSTDQGEDRVPGLSRIPLIGHLFKNRRRSNENNELLIFITPRVVKL